MAHSNAVDEMVSRILKVLPDHPGVYFKLTAALQTAKIAGPWETRPLHPKSLWRVRAQEMSGPQEKRGIVWVYPSMILYPPDETQYWDYDAYSNAREKYEEQRAKWKSWSWSIQIDSAFGYSDTREEALADADNLLRSLGWVLWDGDSG